MILALRERTSYDPAPADLVSVERMILHEGRRSRMSLVENQGFYRASSAGSNGEGSSA